MLIKMSGWKEKCVIVRNTAGNFVFYLIIVRTVGTNMKTLCTSEVRYVNSLRTGICVTHDYVYIHICIYACFYNFTIRKLFSRIKIKEKKKHGTKWKKQK
jgi:hypothetical protein